MREDANAKQVETGAAKHLALEEFEAVDLSLNLAIAKGRGKGGFDRRIVALNTSSKGTEFINR